MNRRREGGTEGNKDLYKDVIRKERRRYERKQSCIEREKKVLKERLGYKRRNKGSIEGKMVRC